jgi:signal transduction histidine kinase
LATVHKIIQEHQGQVSLERTGTDGTVLRILLPETAAKIQVAR